MKTKLWGDVLAVFTYLQAVRLMAVRFAPADRQCQGRDAREFQKDVQAQCGEHLG